MIRTLQCFQIETNQYNNGQFMGHLVLCNYYSSHISFVICCQLFSPGLVFLSRFLLYSIFAIRILLVIQPAWSEIQKNPFYQG